MISFILILIFYQVLAQAQAQDISNLSGSSCENIAWYNDDDEITCSDISLLNDTSKDQICSDLFKFGGHTAYSACCACGGGLPSVSLFENVLVEEASSDVTCIDYVDWKTVKDNTCDSYHNDDQSEFQCEYNGYLEGILSEIPGSTACCVCGGGYKGEMLRKKLRVGVPSDASALYLLFTHPDDGVTRDGSILFFIKKVLGGLGVGMYPIDEYSPSAIAKYPGDSMDNSYSRCLHDASIGNIDICIGEYVSVDTDDFIFLRNDL